ncbi:MAG: penicillin-binding protein 2 [Actinomycetota bacterium]|nr:penicillin-binding protein 2 [Actinomycetota bacterium]
MAALDRRIGWIFVAFLVLLSLAVLRAVDFGVVRAGTLQQAAVSQQISRDVIPAPRGMITDRNGVDLAISESADDVIADNFLIKQPLATAQKLAPLLGKSVLTVLGLLSKHNGGVALARLLPADQATRIMKLQINGISLVPRTTRTYPRGWAASQVIGSVHGSGSGASGLEYRYNHELTGTDGIRRIVNDAIGQPISIDDVRATRPGAALRLTIDAALQDEVEQVLAGVGAQYSPKGATAIVMNPQTGAIMALANWPRVNANDPTSAPTYASQDRAVNFNYEPGSTFKAITVAGALQDGLVSPSTLFNIPSVLQIADRRIHDAEAHGDETLSVADILKKSSNIGADEIGAKLGPIRFDYWTRRFGFGTSTGVNLPGEDGGIILPVSKYSGSSMGNLPFGQGESVTPMQIATAYAAIANGGILRPPHVVQSIGGKPVPAPAGHRIISTSTAAQLRGMLRGVLGEGGTASGAAIPGYDMAGKTGTANIAVGGKYSNTEFVASFVGMVPVNHPSLLGLVVVDQPQGSIFGGAVAAPAFQKIVGWAVPYLGLSPR